MKFLLDESADFPLAKILTQLGHATTSIVHDHERSISDREVLALAVKEQRVLITNDKDFIQLVLNQQLPHTGVILFSLNPEHLEIKKTWLKEVLKNHSLNLSKFIIITNKGIRIFPSFILTSKKQLKSD